MTDSSIRSIKKFINAQPDSYFQIRTAELFNGEYCEATNELYDESFAIQNETFGDLSGEYIPVVLIVVVKNDEILLINDRNKNIVILDESAFNNTKNTHDLSIKDLLTKAMLNKY